MDDLTPQSPGQPSVLHRVRSASRNANVQWLRAAAALAVLLYHVSVYQLILFKDGRFLAVFSGQFGLLGVALFFTISGALMADILPRTEPHRFLAHRLVRIYPLFVVAALIATLVSVGGPKSDPMTFALFPLGRMVDPLHVTWTLIYEIAFYVILFFVSLAGLACHLERIAFAWLGLILVGAFILPDTTHNAAKTYLPLLPFTTPAAAFVVGLLVPRAVRMGLFPPASVMVALSALLAGLAVSPAHQRLTIAIVSFVVVGLAVAAHGREREAAPANRHGMSWFATCFTRLGDYSYALYLVHVPVTLLVYRSATDVSHAVLWVAALTLAMAVCVPFGIADVRAYRFTRRWADAVPHRWLASFNWLYLALFFGISAWYFATAPSWTG